MTSNGTISRTCAAATMVVLMAGPAIATPTFLGADAFAGLEPVCRAELGDLRGGMMIGGIPVNFAVVVRTTVENSLQSAMGLQTTLTIGANGGIATSNTSSIGLPSVTTSGDGLLLSLGNGATNILQRISQDQVQTLVGNAAKDLTITHSTAIDVTVPGLLNTSHAFSSHQQVARMGVDSALAGLGR
jgi:hypothetical protein